MRLFFPLAVLLAVISAQQALADMVVTRELPDGNRIFVKCIGVCDANAINARIDGLRLAPGTQNTSIRIVTAGSSAFGPISVQGQSNAVVAVALGQRNQIGRIAINGTSNLVRVVEQGQNNFASATSAGANNTAAIGIYGSNNRVTSTQSGSNMTTAVNTRGDGTTVAASQIDPNAAPQNVTANSGRAWANSSRNLAAGAVARDAGSGNYSSGRRWR